MITAVSVLTLDSTSSNTCAVALPDLWVKRISLQGSIKPHMFNHHCSNLRGDVAARALAWKVAFYGTLTLLLPLAHLLQSPCSNPKAAQWEDRDSLPNRFSPFLSPNLSLSLSGSLLRSGAANACVYVLNLHWTTGSQSLPETRRHANKKCPRTGTQKSVHAIKGSCLRRSTHVYWLHGFPWVHQAPEEEEEEDEAQRLNIDSLYCCLLSRSGCSISLYPIRGHDGVCL